MAELSPKGVSLSLICKCSSNNKPFVINADEMYQFGVIACVHCQKPMIVDKVIVPDIKVMIFLDGGYVNDIMADGPVIVREIDYDVHCLPDDEVDTIRLPSGSEIETPEVKCSIRKWDLTGEEDLDPFFKQEAIA